MSVPSGVCQKLVKGGPSPAVAGVTAGMIIGGWGARLARTLLHEVQPSDPEIWIGVAAAIALAVALAIAGPTRRALKTSPADALRE